MRLWFLLFLAACSTPPKLVPSKPPLGVLFAQDDNSIYWVTWVPGGNGEVFSRSKSGGDATLVLRVPNCKGSGLAVMPGEIALSCVSDRNLHTSKGRTIDVKKDILSTVASGRDLYAAIYTGYEHRDTMDGSTEPSLFRIEAAGTQELADPLELGEMLVDGDTIFATQCLIAVDNAYDGGIVRIPRAGRPVTVVARQQIEWIDHESICPEHLAVDANDVWFTIGDEVKRMSKVGGPVTVWAKAKDAGGIAVDTKNVYVAARGEHAVVAISKSDRSKTVLANVSDPVLVLIDSRAVRWLEEDGAKLGSFPL